MKIQLDRKWQRGESILGSFAYEKVNLLSLEHPRRVPKVPGITGIPAGEYIIKPRREGEMYQHYCERFKKDHPMLWLQNVPDFEYVYIHIGNFIRDSRACILVGSGYGYEKENYKIFNSAISYERLHDRVVQAWDAKEDVYIKITDLIKESKI